MSIWIEMTLRIDKNVTDRPPVHAKMAHFLLADIENSRFWKRNSRVAWNRAMKRIAFQVGTLLHRGHFRKLHRHIWKDRVVWTLTKIFLGSHFSTFSKWAGIMLTQSNLESDTNIVWVWLEHVWNAQREYNASFIQTGILHHLRQIAGCRPKKWLREHAL